MSATFDRELRGDARRYLLRKRMEGLEVAYLIDDVGPVRPSAAASAGEPAAGEIRLVTSPLPFEPPASIRYQSSPAPAAQGSLFDENSPRPRGPSLGALDMSGLEKVVSACTKCPLSEGRTKTVFGSGNPRARIVFVGEAPGREEDLQGLPFVGRAGQLLTKMLGAIGMSRDEVYIANILKCRPPGNRQPAEDEMRACEPYLARQLELIEPLIICALGLVAAHGLLKRNASLGSLRQGIHYYNDIRVAVTYHPAALLRNPNLKRDAWEDLQAIRRLYDEALKENA